MENENLAADGCLGCLFVYCFFLVMVVGGLFIGWPIIVLAVLFMTAAFVWGAILLLLRGVCWVIAQIRPPKDRGSE